MATKAALFSDIVEEFIKAQAAGLEIPNKTRRGFIFPPLIPTGDGTQYSATDKLLQDTGQLAEILRNNDNVLLVAYSESEFRTLVDRCIGRAIQQIFAQSREIDATVLRTEFDGILLDELSRRRGELTIILGCSLIRDQPVYPITVGPITFDERLHWLQQVQAANRISSVTARRIKRAWSGGRLGERKLGWDQHAERSILESVGSEPVVCAVRTNDLSLNVAQQKGAHCARLAMTAIALLWEHPQAALERMHLTYDGASYLRRYAVMGPNRRVTSGSSMSKIPGGMVPTQPLGPNLQRFQKSLDVVGEALHAYLLPSSPVTAPCIKNAIFLSLWWYH